MTSAVDRDTEIHHSRSGAGEANKINPAGMMNPVDQQAPPGYHISTGTKSAPPPYECIYRRVQAIHKQSSGTVNCCDKLLSILFGSLMFVIVGGVMMGIPISMICVGIVYLDECPRAYLIPIYLIGGGSVTCVHYMTFIIRAIVTKTCGKISTENEIEKYKRQHPFITLVDAALIVFGIAWFLMGNYYVYWAYNNNECRVMNVTTSQHDIAVSGMPSEVTIKDGCLDADYCSQILLLFSFWLITGIYITCGTISCCLCCVGCFASVPNKHRRT